MKKIVLELQKDTESNACTLNHQDIYNYVGECTEQEVEFALYIEKWCEYLNYYILNNKEMAFGDTDYARLEGWLAGYNFAKKIDVTNFKDRVEIKMKGYFVILNRPFEF